MAGEGCLCGGHAGGALLQDFVLVSVGEVFCDSGSVDVADRGAVVGRVHRTIVLQEFRNIVVEGGLEKRNSRSRAMILSDQNMGRVSFSQGARENNLRPAKRIYPEALQTIVETRHIQCKNGLEH